MEFISILAQLADMLFSYSVDSEGEQRGLKEKVVMHFSFASQ